MKRLLVAFVIALGMHAGMLLIAVKSQQLDDAQPKPRTIRISMLKKKVLPARARQPEPKQKIVVKQAAPIGKKVSPKVVPRSKVVREIIKTPKIAAKQIEESAVAGPPPISQTSPPGDITLTPVSHTEAIPKYKTNPKPVYPALAKKRGYEGEVELLVVVSETGRVDKVEILKGSGYAILDRAAQRAVKYWRFFPATRGGSPVEMAVRVPVRFRLEKG